MGDSVKNQSFKVMLGEKKRDSSEFEERSELCSKLPKMRDLNSVFRSEESTDLVKSRGLSLDLNAEDVSSSITPSEEKDAMKIWKEMKQNGFLSSSNSGFRIPKPQVKQITTKNDGTKRKMEISTKEQINKFAKVAAPSGLLNALNPGIINHVRNSKQVHSIIEALVKNEKVENVKSSECIELESVSMDSELANGDGDSYTIAQEVANPSHVNQSSIDQYNSSQSHGESANTTSVTSLSVKAANVATQWLELQSQDIKGRLSALRRSKKRVRAVINSELPYLVSTEFSSSQENGEAHQARWGVLFHQMENSLCDEEKQLESSLKQVKEMRLSCEKGLNELNASNEGDNLDKELPVRAAAASIYSTCNFLSSMENHPCY